ncbi:phenylalanine--tRNA ligase beta subunit-related protein [Microbacterium sp.]|uniref:B3/B4 domain-containing protein n=1 Tax=Microbacterium sp. TaxID=51671 RepID=UPI0028124257|nr:phenylalanine--tRNA ligase beta subunit-related protein [Microbacterium sp.]
MRFTHSPQLMADFPQLSVATLRLTDVTDHADVAATAQPFFDRAAARLAERSESEFPEIAAWRRAFAQMGLKPTQYRCASEALLRRFKKEGALPSIHPLVDLCNAVSIAYATPIAVFDLEHVDGDLTVRRADGSETYATFGGEQENPAPGEVIFADDAGNAHARRWTNRQSALSAIRPATRSVLIVSEAMHETGADDITTLRGELREALSAHWSVSGD